jgi:phage terminase small subunit
VRVVDMVFYGKQLLFVEEYLKDLDSYQAALRAGYKNGGTGQNLLNNPDIKALIDERIEERKLMGVTPDMVIAELARIAFADLTDFVKWTKTGRIGLRPCDQVDGKVLSSIEETINGKTKTRKVKLHDKLKALELLGRHLGMFTDNLKVDADMQVQIIDDIK